MCWGGCLVPVRKGLDDIYSCHLAYRHRSWWLPSYSRLQPCLSWLHGWTQIPAHTSPAFSWYNLGPEETKAAGSRPAPVAYFTILVQVTQMVQITLWKWWDNIFGKLTANLLYSQCQEDKQLGRRSLPGLRILSKLVLGHWDLCFSHVPFSSLWFVLVVVVFVQITPRLKLLFIMEMCWVFSPVLLPTPLFSCCWYKCCVILIGSRSRAQEVPPLLPANKIP